MTSHQQGTEFVDAMTGTDGIYLLIPAYNAGEHLRQVLGQAKQYIPGDRILLVDDGSTDHTPLIAEESGVRVISHERNRGKGAALSTGFHCALDAPDMRAVICMDADGQHDPGMIPEFARAFAEDAGDLIIGCRGWHAGNMPWIRRVSNNVTTFLVSLRVGLNVRDSQSGYRLCSRQVLEQIGITLAGAQAETELLLRTLTGGFRLGYVPIPTIYGSEASHIRPLQDIADFVLVYVESWFYGWGRRRAVKRNQA